MLQGRRKAVAGPLLWGSPREAAGPVWAQSGDWAGKSGTGSESLTLPTYAAQRLCLTSGDNEAIWGPQALLDTRLWGAGAPSQPESRPRSVRLPGDALGLKCQTSGWVLG